MNPTPHRLTPANELWQPSPAPPALGPDEMHVWRVQLEPGKEVVAAFRGLLTPQEIQRADRYVFDHLTRRYIAGQGALRILLSHYLRIEPHAVTFYPGPKGKPYLSPALGKGPLQFNVSNSADRAVIAFTLGREVGVDIEAWREVTYGQSVARSHFAPGEHAQLPTKPGEAWNRAFFNCWTRKEAFIKLTGEGLSRPLDSFEVSLRPEDPPRVVRVDDDHQAEDRYALIAFDPGPGYTAALIVEGKAPKVSYFDFSAG